MTTRFKKFKQTKGGSMNSGSGGAIYCLGIIGSMVYWIQQAEGFWPVIWAIIKAFVWPAFVVYDALKHLA